MDNAANAGTPAVKPAKPIFVSTMGFTLIELLVAIAIAAILSGMAIVSLNVGGHDKQMEEEAQRVFQLARIASDDAVFKTAQYGVRFTRKGYTFYRLEDRVEEDDGEDKDTVRRWMAVEDNAKLRTREWPDDMVVDVYVEGIAIVLDEQRDAKAEAADKKLRPHIMFLSNGEIMPDTEIHLSSSESQKAWRVGIDDDGVLAVRPLQQ